MLCGIKDTFVPSIYSLVSYWLMALPLGYFLAFPCGLGISGIWYGILLGVIVSALLLHLRYQKLLNSNQIFELADA
jgi:MATE family multidrug resistance protein